MKPDDQLIEIAECIRAQLIELHKRPTPERIEVMMIALEGVRRHLGRLRDSLIEEALAMVPGGAKHDWH